MKFFGSLFRRSKSPAPLLAPPPTAVAAGIIAAVAEISDKRPDQAKLILRNMWLDISPFLIPAIDKDPLGKYVPSILILEAYFRHSGDWKKMQEQMRSGFVSKNIEDKISEIVSREFLNAAEKSK